MSGADDLVFGACQKLVGKRLQRGEGMGAGVYIGEGGLFCPYKEHIIAFPPLAEGEALGAGTFDLR